MILERLEDIAFYPKELIPRLELFGEDRDWKKESPPEVGEPEPFMAQLQQIYPTASANLSSEVIAD